MHASAPDQPGLAFVADEAIARIFDMLNAPRPRTSEAALACEALWSRLPPISRVTWLHAACLDGGECLSHWAAFSSQERAELLLALENMMQFFQRSRA